MKPQRLTPIDIIRAQRRRPLDRDSLNDEKQFIEEAMRQYYRAEYVREERRLEWIARAYAVLTLGAIGFLAWLLVSDAGQRLLERIF